MTTEPDDIADESDVADESIDDLDDDDTGGALDPWEIKTTSNSPVIDAAVMAEATARFTTRNAEVNALIKSCVAGKLAMGDAHEWANRIFEDVIQDQITVHYQARTAPEQTWRDNVLGAPPEARPIMVTKMKATVAELEAALPFLEGGFVDDDDDRTTL